MPIQNDILTHESQIRLFVFIGVFVLLSLWEIIAPKKSLTINKTKRWSANLFIVVLNTISLRILFPIAAVGAALYAEQNNLGMHRILSNFQIKHGITLVGSIIFLDFIIYWQHVLFHRIPFFWKIHRMHHADQDIDITTGTRFHLFEIILSMLIKISVIVLVGIPWLAVLLFEIILNAMAMFNHSNIHLPRVIDKLLRKMIVTPDMHRVHHSVHSFEMHTNFGFNLSLWDRLFKTYTAQPKDGHQEMVIGLPEFRNIKETQQPLGMLMIPFKNTR